MADEIDVEGEPWTGLVVVADNRSLVSAPGHYGLVQASEWKWNLGPGDPERKVVVWKGPAKRDELIQRKDLSEMECQTVLVDEHGFYTCPPIIDLVKDEAIKRAREWFDIEANQRAAESQSYVDSEEYSEKLGEDVMAIAWFGDAVAVNGEWRGGKLKIPKGWVKIEEAGGRIPGGHEEQVDLDYVSESIAREISEELKRQIDKKDVEAILKKEFTNDRNYMMWTSDSGEAEVYVEKKALKAYERRIEEERNEKQRRYELEQAARRAKEAEERKQKVRRGGYPRPKDWSPTGETDWTPPRQ